MTTSAPKTRTPVSSGKDYGYSNARIRGMRSRLMSREFLDNLIASHDVGALIQALSDTEYGPDLDDVLIKGRDATTIDEALKNNMVRTFRKVHSVLNEEAGYVLTTLLGRWDVFNIKTILRGTHMHLVNEEIAEGLLPVGYLSQVELDALAMLEDVRAVVDTAATWGLPYASAMRAGYVEYMKSGELADLELAMDRYYSDWANSRLGRRGANMRIARTLLERQVDVMNLVMVFRLQKSDVGDMDVDSFFLEGGHSIDIDMYRELAQMSDVDEVLDRLRTTPYGKALDEVAVKYLEENSIAVFERALEDHLVRKATALGASDPLGVGVAIAYLWSKQNEVTNLRIIVKGKAVGMPEDRVRGELILV